MNEPANGMGYFVLSLDTEMRWGYFDRDQQRRQIFSPDGGRERRSIEGLLALCDEYGIRGTWALVGHLFLDRCEECQVCPLAHWEGRYASFQEIYRTADPRWYAGDTIRALLASGDRHEIAFHGYTHEVFDRLDREGARREIQEWRRVAAPYGVTPRSLVFPRNVIRYLDLFEAEGFSCFRSVEIAPPSWTQDIWGRVRKHLDLLVGRNWPRLYTPDELKGPGIIDVRASGHLFLFNRRLELALDRLGLYRLRLSGLRAAVRRAAREGKVLHLWAHPWELRTPRDFAKMRYLFALVAEEISAGRMRSVSMTEMARIVRAA